MILYVVLKSKEELSTLKSLIVRTLVGIEYEDSFLYVELQYIKSTCTCAHILKTSIPKVLVSIEELQHWLLLVSMSWSPEEALTQITGGT